MKYNFDELIDRRNTNAVKIDEMKDIWDRNDLIPMWVADMDFATPDFVVDAVKKRCEHPVFGYTAKSDGYYNSIINWVKARYGMEIEKKHINYVPGIVAGLGMALNCFTSPGDKVVIMPPVYHPFAWLTKRNNRQLVECPMIFENGEYRMNLELLRSIKKGVRVLILCNPHNPGGVVWKREELEELAEICAEDNILVFSDEIHADLTLPPHKHLPFAMVSEKAKKNSVTFMAPSKTFNMPGVAASHTIIYNDALRGKFETYLEAGELNAGHVFAFPAVEAAYSNGTEWLDQCLDYIQGNIDYVDSFLKENAPKIKAIRPMASYLIWLDCRELGLNHEELNSFFVDKAGLALNDGEMFGREGAGFMRMNVGTQRSVVELAMNQLAEAYKTL
ncbi:MAG: PatB family C-S lyase [Candidatus Phocaeicola faecigallinarum]|uniref:cysteine-S-conjugate beta-lyase n=1 Tax=Candidatus Phocaeicola faecigallinarum TaxID=2838732 RepID=A0A948TDX7_9BACT|nr:PatB family C-S lyase [uncultured Bacteroides sp.]MBU3839212.1 PatB family C-S lyase [Candidatus Phocaeicola faecigallinarum]